MIWGQNKEKVADYTNEELKTSREQGKAIKDAGGKSDSL
jgi:hypothetical protein